MTSDDPAVALEPWPDGPVLMTFEGAVAVLTLNRPERGNAWTDEMATLYFRALRELAAHDAVRAIVLTGAGKQFCVGVDMDALERTVDTQGSMVPDHVDYTVAIDHPKPIVAAINGACAGLGLVVALSCDVRMVDAAAKLTTAFVRRGLVAEAGADWMLARLVGQANAADLLLSGRVLRGEEAVQIGLANRSLESDVLGAAIAYAHDLATWSSPTSMALIKRQLSQVWSTDLREAQGYADELMRWTFTRPDMGEGVAAFLQRRTPSFPPLRPGDLPFGVATDRS